MTPILSETFAPPRIATDGRAGFSVTFAQCLELTHHQEPGRALRYKSGHADGRGMGAMRGAEGVVDVDVLAAREFVGEVAIVGLFLGMKAQVFEQDRASPGRARRSCGR